MQQYSGQQQQYNQQSYPPLQQQYWQPYNQQSGSTYGLQAEVTAGAALATTAALAPYPPNSDQFRSYNPQGPVPGPSMFGLHTELGGALPPQQQYSDAHRLQDQQLHQGQDTPPAAPPLFTLDQIPSDQGRFVKLLPHQANDVLEQVMMRVGGWLE